MAIELHPFWSLSYSLVEVPSFISQFSWNLCGFNLTLPAHSSSVKASTDLLHLDLLLHRRPMVSVTYII
ncbi:hypothetical protein COLO4_38099 [Corchorus olitorius]|uniref:Uncharacterized protein n=1 Tax=Corchorus olitorius TaxID=93759 RepID=A0A1R3FX69_9ROSI|nr:hypothetical protein COLO4_38099 [Corchorus olitorius]